MCKIPPEVQEIATYESAAAMEIITTVMGTIPGG